MAEPWGAIGLLLAVAGVAHALWPDAVWRIRHRTLTRRTRDRLTGPDGGMLASHRRLERWGGVGAATVGGVVTLLAFAAR